MEAIGDVPRGAIAWYGMATVSENGDEREPTLEEVLAVPGVIGVSVPDTDEPYMFDLWLDGDAERSCMDQGHWAMEHHELTGDDHKVTRVWIEAD